MGALLAGEPGLVPCTPAGVMRLLESAGIAVAGRRAVVIGRSNIVGKPLALLLLQRDATVTICHSKTRDLEKIAREADILVAAIGRAKLVGAAMVKPGACVIDVGVNRLADGSLAGDVDFAAVKDVAGWITPVPGGVGPMTIAMLLENCLHAAER
jgi:methylenetetrahydrofolate dehydrogenase (NADP+)/methenyltetrahydrofolate cyclohydrolase